MSTADTQPDGPDQPEWIDLPRRATVVVRDRVAMARIREFFDGAFAALGNAIATQQLVVTDAPFACYHGLPSDTVDIEVGFVTDSPVRAADGVGPGHLPACRAARLLHLGSFDTLGASWERLGAWIGAHDAIPAGQLWEIYLTEPHPDMDPADLRTELVWPVEPLSA